MPGLHQRCPDSIRILVKERINTSAMTSAHQTGCLNHQSSPAQSYTVHIICLSMRNDPANAGAICCLQLPQHVSLFRAYHRLRGTQSAAKAWKRFGGADPNHLHCAAACRMCSAGACSGLALVLVALVVQGQFEGGGERTRQAEGLADVVAVVAHHEAQAGRQHQRRQQHRDRDRQPLGVHSPAAAGSTMSASKARHDSHGH